LKSGIFQKKSLTSTIISTQDWWLTISRHDLVRFKDSIPLMTHLVLLDIDWGRFRK